MYDNLKFRRQFIFSSDTISQLSNWQKMMLGQNYLYSHPDLEMNYISSVKCSIVLLGSIFDPSAPEKDNKCILKSLHNEMTRPEDLFSLVHRLIGRYVIIYTDDDAAFVFNDPLSLREIFYSTNENLVLCASQPNLLLKYAVPEILKSKDSELMDFYHKNSIGSKWNPYRKWIGDETIFEGVRHLLPNHFLDLKERVPKRYWPNGRIKKYELKDAVAKASEYLQGGIKAISNRHSVMMAVTSGTDSRTLLAASKECKERIYYFINRNKLSKNHPDITVPSDIFRGIGVLFHIHDVPDNVDSDFREIFLSNTFFSSDRILPAIYNVYYKNLADKVNLIGIGEIGRTRYGKQPKKLDGYRLAYKLGHKESPYAIRKGKQIYDELLPVSKESGINILTLLYWEHTLGNWGATGNSESDIAIEEINPYDSHYLYELILGVDSKYSKYYKSVFFEELISSMWPDLMRWPINPPLTLKDKIIDNLYKYGIYNLLKEIKYRYNRFHYRHLVEN